MAMLIHVAMITTMAMIYHTHGIIMTETEFASKSSAPARGRQADEILGDIFFKAGWRVDRQPTRDSHKPDMVVRKGRASYAVEVKAAAEGRSDRLIPLWAQACLQAVQAAGEDYPPLAIVAAPRIAPR